MTLQSQSCSQSSIARLLDNTLDEHELAAMEQHLEHCSQCADRLTQLSADQSFWNDTQRFLSSVDELPALAAVTHDFSIDVGGDDTPRDAASDIPLQPTDDPQMLGRFGGYEISGIIGRGGMGVVLKGWDRSLDRFVAIKVLSPTYAHQPAARQRFAREAKAAAAVVHDNVVAIFGVERCNDLPYLVMPYVKGESLQKRIDREAPLSLEAILEISVQIARGLQAAHDQGVIHRDIKPANILLPQSVSRVLITDFGLARAADDATLTHSGTIAGTPAYMSPEQARGDAVDARTDLFSLGCVIYAMATGHPPFRAESSYGILRRIIDDAHRPLNQECSDLPRWFARIVDQLLAKQPAQRFASAAVLAEHLEACLAHLRQPTINPLPVLASQRSDAGLRWLYLGIALAIVAAICIQLIFRWSPIASSTATTHSINDDTWAEVDAELDQLDRFLKQIEQEYEE